MFFGPYLGNPPLRPGGDARAKGWPKGVRAQQLQKMSKKSSFWQWKQILIHNGKNNQINRAPSTRDNIIFILNTPKNLLKLQ